MKKGIQKYIQTVGEELEKEKISNQMIEKHLHYIAFYQHERLVHLLVTITFAFLTFLTLFSALFFESLLWYLLFLICFFLLIPYILYYYTLENGIQKMYHQYEKMLDKKEEK